MAYSSFPLIRLRRTRMQPWVRDLIQENHLHVTDLIWPIFIIEGENKTQTIATLPDVHRLSIDKAVQAARYAEQLGIRAIALFPVIPTALKTENGNEALNPDNLICRSVKAIKQATKNLGVICDVALDPYTTHGHDGIFRGGEILNDETVKVLCEQALNQVKAGCDIIAPSDMQDGRIGAIRRVLEQENFHNTLIMAYTAKYASKFYGPFRDAIGSNDNILGKDKLSYQQHPANGNEALREAALDIQEGADMIMVKPGLPYLDVLYRLKSTYQMPTFLYQVSGEYAMMKFASQQGCFDFNQIMFESVLCCKRAGADGIFTYAAAIVAEFLQNQSTVETD